MSLYDMDKQIERELVELKDRKGVLFNRDRVLRELATANHGRRGSTRSAFWDFACSLPLASRSRACSEPGS